MLNSSIVISPLVLFCFQGRLIKQFGELITFFCQFKCLLALAPFAILQKIRYTDRGTEQDGVDYHFLSRDEFKAKIEADEFIEYAEVHGNFYGTLKSEVVDRVTKGIDVILDIDVQGAAKVHELCRTDDVFRDCAEFVFVAPPSYAELERRLRGRGTDAEAVILKRLENSRLEISRWREYSYLLINDDFGSAAERFNALLLAFRMSTRRWKENINA